MKRHKSMHVHNKAVTIVLLPAMMLFWLLGWSLYWTGTKNRPEKPKPATETGTSITADVLLEDSQELKT